MSERLAAANDDTTVACPECDTAEVMIRQRYDNVSTGDLDAPYRCQECSATFETAVVRPHKEQGASAGEQAKYGSLTLEDVGLDNPEVQR